MLSAHFPEVSYQPAMIRLVSERLAGRVDRLWLGQPLVMDPHAVFAHSAGTGNRLRYGTSVSLMGLRSPLDAALQASSAATLSGEPFVAGLGPGGVDFQRSVLGAPYLRPLQAVRDYVAAVRGALDTMGDPDVQVGLGVLRPGMARLAGEIADVAITWLCPPGYHRDVLVPALAAGAGAAGRPAPHVVAVVHAAGTGARPDPIRYLLGVSGRHLQAPHYLDMLGRAGVDKRTDDPRHTARQVIRSGAFLYGDAAEVAAGVERYREAGVDEVVLNTSCVAVQDGPLTGLHDLLGLLPTALTPGTAPVPEAGAGAPNLA